MKELSCFVILFLTVSGCKIVQENEDIIMNPTMNFDISYRIAAGKDISGIVAIDRDNYFYSSGNLIFYVENSREKQLEATSKVLAMAWNDPDNALWIGTFSSGLARMKEGNISYFTQKTDNLPRDLVYDLVCDSNGAVWFSSSAHLLGGLGRWYDDKFKFYTPDNSSLPDNLIKSIACSGDKVYIATGGTVTQQKVVEIDGNRWKLLPFEGYYLMDMDADKKGNIYVIDDTGLSSTIMPNKIYHYDYVSCRDILPKDTGYGYHPRCLKTDLRNYLWISAFSSEINRNLTVYDGKTWHETPHDFPDMSINCISVDNNNSIWLGTNDGIYVLKQ